MDEENNNEDILEQQAKKLKKALLKKIKIYAIKTIAFIIIISLIAGIFLSVLNTVGKTVKTIVNAVTDFFSIDTDGAIVITDEQIDEIINGVTDLGIDMEGLKLMGDIDYSNPDIQEEYQKQKRKFIREFYEAQAMTQTLNTNPNWLEELASGGKPYGTVYVSRETQDTTDPTKKNPLKYIPYEEMMKKIEESSGAIIESEAEEARKKDIIKYFSIDEEGKLVIAGWENTIVEQNGIMMSKQTQIKKIAIDYKSAVAQYTTPMHFLICLAMVSENPEFVLAVTDLVKRSDIRISLMDVNAKDISTETHTYIENIKTRKEVESVGYDAWDTEHQFPYPVYTYEESVRQEPREEVIVTTTTSQNPMVAVTYAKTWFSEQTVTYNKTTEGPDTTQGEPMDGAPDDPEPQIEGEGTESWITDRKIKVDTVSTKEKYEEGVRGDVIDKTGERGSPGIKDINGNGVVDKGETVDLNGDGILDLPEKVDEDTTFMGLLDAKFKIPNSTRYDSAIGNIKSGSGILFFLLQQDASTQNLEQLMRYVLNKYDNEPDKYGHVKKEDLFSSFEARMLTTGENYVVNTTMAPKELWITDEEVLKAAIARLYTGKMKENLTKEVKTFLAMQEKYNVNAVFAIAVAILESSAGTGWDYIDSSTYNWFSIQGAYKGQSYIDRNQVAWKKYSSAKEAIMDFGDHIAVSSPLYYKAGNYSVEQIAQAYIGEELAAEWAKRVRSFMNEIYAEIGVETIAEEAKIGGITTDTEATQWQNYVETSMLHTHPHRAGEYQDGPFATWWTRGYNNLEKFQCTWWAYGRASMYLQQHGTKYKQYPTQWGHGGQYYEINKKNKWFKYGNTPKPNSIISWSYGKYGHVAYVEGVTSDGIYISHAGAGTTWYGIQKIPLNGSLWPGYSLNGYIYLGEPYTES